MIYRRVPCLSNENPEMVGSSTIGTPRPTQGQCKLQLCHLSSLICLRVLAGFMQR